jgi:hypothetical protein
VIHGGGDGFDQGELLAQALLGDDIHWLTPSRFGHQLAIVEQVAIRPELRKHILDHHDNDID